MDFRAEVRIELKKGVIDAEGETVQKSLNLLGYPAKKVDTVKVYVIDLEADSKEKANKIVEEACKKLLANPVIQNYSVKINEK